MKIKNLAVVALFAVAGSAFATDYNEPLDANGNIGTPVTGQAPVNGAISDKYNFSVLTAQNSIAGSVYGLGEINTIFTDVSLWNTTTGVMTSFIQNDLDGQSWSLAPTVLGAGDYTWKITGSAAGQTFYGAELSVLAVPEPETYAMMLAGLGLLGFAARRRQAE